MRFVRTTLLALGLALGVGLGAPVASDLIAPVPAVAQDGPTAYAAEEDPLGHDRAEVQIPVAFDTTVGTTVRVHAPARHAGLARGLVDHADHRLPVLSERLRMAPGGTIDVFVATTDEQFRDIQPGTPPSWADATAYPDLGVVYLRAPGARHDDEPLTQVLDHELVHILVGRRFAPEHPPTWLQEGLAQMHAETFDQQDLASLAQASYSGPIPLSDLEGAFPKNPHRASLAYAESVDFLIWLERTYGDEAVHTLVGTLAGGEPLHVAVLEATGEPLYAIDEAWRSRFSLTSPIAWTRMVSWDGMWLLSALLGIVAMFVVRRRNRKRRDEIAAEEARGEAIVQAIWEGRFGVR